LLPHQGIKAWSERILGKGIGMNLSRCSGRSRLDPDVDLIWLDEDPIACLQGVRAILDQPIVGRVHRYAVPAHVLYVEDAAPERDLGVPP